MNKYPDGGKNGLGSSSRRAFLAKVFYLGVGATIVGLVPSTSLAQISTSGEIDKKLQKNPWYNDLYKQIQKQVIQGGGTLLDVPLFMYSKVIEFLKINKVLSVEQLGIFANGYNGTQQHNQILLKLLGEPQVDEVLRLAKVDDILNGKSINPNFTDELWYEIESLFGIDLDALHKQYGRETILYSGGAITGFGAYVLLKYFLGKRRIAKLHAKINTLSDERDQILGQIADTVGYISQDGDDNVDDLLQKITDLEAANKKVIGENTRLQRDIEEIRQKIFAATQQKPGATTGTMDDMIRQIKSVVADLEKRIESITFERDEAKAALSGFEFQVGMMQGGREFIERFSSFATMARALFEKMDAEGIKAFGKAVFITQEEVDGVLIEVNQLVRQVAANMSEEEQGVWLDIPVRLIQQGETKSEKGELKDAYRMLIGVKTILEFIQQLNQGAGGDQASSNQNSDWESMKETQFRDLSNIILENQEIADLLGGNQKGCEVGKIVDPFLLFGVGFSVDYETVKKQIKPKYRKLAQIHHPDKHKKNTPEIQKQHEDMFKIIGGVWGLIEDQEKFTIYVNALKSCYPERYNN